MKWMRFWRRYSWSWMAQEYLPGRNYGWVGLIKDGKLVSSGAMERLQYLMSHISASGVTGNVRLARTVHEIAVNEVCERVCSLLGSVTGVVSIDLREDVHGEPCVTEVSPRFAGRPWLYTCAGANFPDAVVRIVQGEEVNLPRRNPPEAKWLAIRQVDVEPVVIREVDIKRSGKGEIAQ